VPIVDTLISLGIAGERGELDPEAVRDLCKAFAEAYTAVCPQCLAEDPEFWSLAPEQRVVHIIAYGLSLYFRRPVSPLAVATAVKVDRLSVEACREAFAEAGLGW
jgi:hypothetical protein